MKHSMSALFVAVVGMTFVGQADAQYQIVSPISSFEDTFYDFEVYAAEDPGDGFFIIWEMSDGSTRTYGPYYSYQGAQDHLMRILFGGWEPAGYVDVDIVEMPLEPEYMLFETVGTRAEANELAEFLESFGLLTQIRRVSRLQYQIR